MWVLYALPQAKKEKKKDVTSVQVIINGLSQNVSNFSYVPNPL